MKQGEDQLDEEVIYDEFCCYCEKNKTKKKRKKRKKKKKKKKKKREGNFWILQHNKTHYWILQRRKKRFRNAKEQWECEEKLVPGHIKTVYC